MSSKHTAKSHTGILFLECALIAAKAVPLLLRAAVFSATAAPLSALTQGSITLISYVLAWQLVALALIFIRHEKPTFLLFLTTSIHTGLFCGPAVMLEIMGYQKLFRPGAILPSSLFTGLLTLLIGLLAAHTCVWFLLLVDDSTEDTFLPNHGLFLQAWSALLHHPGWLVISWVSTLLPLWFGDTVFHVLAIGPLSFLYRSIAGSLLLIVLFDFVLAVLMRQLLHCCHRILQLERARLNAAEASARNNTGESNPIELRQTLLDARQADSSSAESLLLASGFSAASELFDAPARIVREDLPESDAPSVRKSSSVWMSFLPLALLVLFVAIFGIRSRVTAGGMLQSTVSASRAAAEIALEQGNTQDAAAAYTGGLADLRSIQAYFVSLDDRTPAEAAADDAHIAAYVKEFDEIRTLNPTCALSYLLESKLLLRDGQIEPAIRLLQTLIASDEPPEEAYLLLLAACKAAGPSREADLQQTIRFCNSRRIYADSFAHFDVVSASDRAMLLSTIAPLREEFFLESQLLTWQAAREAGNLEQSFNGLYALLTVEDGQRYGSDLRVLESFIRTGSAYRVRADGSTNRIDEYRLLTADAALKYDKLITERAAADKGSSVTADVKIFVGTALLDCQQYETAKTYLEEARERFPSSEALLRLYEKASELTAKSGADSETGGDTL